MECGGRGREATADTAFDGAAPDAPPSVGQAFLPVPEKLPPSKAVSPLRSATALQNRNTKQMLDSIQRAAKRLNMNNRG